MIAGRLNTGKGAVLANALILLALVAGTHALAVGVLDWNPARWMTAWSGDVVLVAAGLLFLTLAVLLPLHSGFINLGVHAQFLAGYSIGALIVREAVLGPAAEAGLSLIAGTIAGSAVGVMIAWLRRRFAVHEILSGLAFAALLTPVARAVSIDRVAPPALAIDLPALTEPLRSATDLDLAPTVVLGWGILLLTLALALSIMFAHYLRSSVSGFEVRASGANPLAATAVGTDVGGLQRSMMAMGGACAGLSGALQLWSTPAVALERWPFPLGFAGLAIALLGLGSMRGAVFVALVLAAWLNTSYAGDVLSVPGYGAGAAALLLLPALWVLPRLLPDSGAPRSIWRTRHRD
jgi:simple sugar transport system permease protein